MKGRKGRDPLQEKKRKSWVSILALGWQTFLSPCWAIPSPLSLLCVLMPIVIASMLWIDITLYGNLSFSVIFLVDAVLFCSLYLRIY